MLIPTPSHPSPGKTKIFVLQRGEYGAFLTFELSIARSSVLQQR